MSRHDLCLTFGVVLLAAAACGERREARNPRVMREFPATGVKKVLIRVAEAEAGEVISDPTGDSVVISGEPCATAGDHSPESNGPEIPPPEWGLGFVAHPHGPVLVISSRNEIQYTHHCRRLRTVRVRVPVGVEVLWQKRELTGDGTPDLAPPAAP